MDRTARMFVCTCVCVCVCMCVWCRGKEGLGGECNKTSKEKLGGGGSRLQRATPKLCSKQASKQAGRQTGRTWNVESADKIERAKKLLCIEGGGSLTLKLKTRIVL